MDFIAIGDTTVDEFIKLREAHISYDVNHETSTLSMPFATKIPYDSAVLVPAVGNAANAAVAAARLGLSAGFVGNIGNDDYGRQILATLADEGVDTSFIAVHEGIPTNHHYVLSFNAERTILIRHEAYPYRLPEALGAPKWLYLSSLGEHSEAFHREIAEWLAAHPQTRLAFQPGTFQIKMGRDALKDIYARAEVVACNSEEAENILGLGDADMKELLRQMRALGPRIALITDGKNGAYAADGQETLRIPMYPDPSPPENRTGAGDAMTATFVIELSLGKPLAEALRSGPVNSMSVVQHIGAQKGLLTRDALEQYLANAPAEYSVEPI